MTVRTMGTTATTTLSAIQYSQSPFASIGVPASPSTAPADMATLKAALKDDLNPNSVSPNSFFDFNGLLMIPRRGLVRVFPGDFIAWDAQTGWPILVSAAAAALNPSWVHT